MAQKLKNFIKAYYYFFDLKLKNTTIIIGLVGVIILCVGMLLGGKYEVVQNYNPKVNILELQKDQIIKIGEIQYRISLEPIK